MVAKKDGPKAASFVFGEYVPVGSELVLVPTLSNMIRPVIEVMPSAELFTTFVRTDSHTSLGAYVIWVCFCVFRSFTRSIRTSGRSVIFAIATSPASKLSVLSTKS